MKFRIKSVLMAAIVGFGVLSFSCTSFAGRVLKVGMSGEDVCELQRRLAQENYYSYKITGYFGEKTKKAVKDFQRVKGIAVDGMVGKDTKRCLGLEDKETYDKYYKGTWFGGGNKIFASGKEATVYDIDTGKTFRVRRTYGTNHADCEPLTKEDTKIMKEIVGGYWNWNRRAIVVTGEGGKSPASMHGMPHAGLDNKPAGAYVRGRSGGFGSGTNYDAIKGNDMDGHFCIHLRGSKLHIKDKVEPKHQAMVRKATKFLEQQG